MPHDPSTKEGLDQMVAERVGVVAAGALCVPVLTPTLGTISMWWHLTQIDIQYPMNVGKQPITTLDVHGGEVGEMRNRLVAMALAIEDQSGGATRVPAVFWCDDDVIADRMVLGALGEHFQDPNVKIASGVYFCKGEFGEPLIFPGPSAGTTPFRPNEVFESWGWAQGLCLVSTEVYRRQRDELDLGVDKYGQPAWYKVPGFELTKTGIVNGGTEDFHFFSNCEKLGYRPVVDCRQAAFGFHFDYRTKVGYPRKQWEQYVRKEPIIWPGNSSRPEVVWKPL